MNKQIKCLSEEAAERCPCEKCQLERDYKAAKLEGLFKTKLDKVCQNVLKNEL
jgi:hypothetical protein